MLGLPTPAPDALPPQKTYERFFFVQKRSFATVGIDPTSFERTIISYGLFWIPFFAMVTIPGPALLLARNYITDLNVVARILTPVWQSILAGLKICVFMWQRKKIIFLVRKVWLWNLDGFSILQQQKGSFAIGEAANAKEAEILTKENVIDQKITSFYFVLVAVSGFSAILIYILDIHETYIGYLFAFVWGSLAIYCICNGSLAIDSLFSWFVCNFVGLFRILNLKFKTLAESGNLSDGEFKDGIRKCVMYHLQVIKLVESFNEVYKTIIFLKFLISCFQIAFIVFQFPNTEEMGFQLMHASFLSSVATQLMLYCHGGQKIKDMI
ncbi:odorant receptor 45a-like [Stomoxys calcitrans]|uniref:odorant receptor 45a-like n=1 Tax=Stomoxys calcitrans TaxID=35570 RepID=UPI0027E29011|nr:odorant receptor 45a-like [Stomoxys calcitrans]